MKKYLQGLLVVIISGILLISFNESNAQSCNGNCGGSGGVCWCDDGCWAMGDCCADVCTYCGSWSATMIANCGGGGGSPCQETGTVSGTDNTNPTITFNSFPCAGGCAITGMTLNASFTDTWSCPTWYAFRIIVNGTTIQNGLCNVNGYNLTPYLPITSLQIQAYDTDAWGDFITLNATVNVEYDCGGGGCTTPGTPINLSGAGTGQTTATISWNAGTPAGSATVTYDIEVYEFGGGLVASGNVAGSPVNVTGLTCGTTYYFRVRAHTNCDNTYSAWSANSANFSTSACGGAGGCNIEITVYGSGWGDEVSWTFRNSFNVIVLSGGPYGSGYSDTQSLTATDVPYTFYLETMGFINDNIANYIIRIDGVTIFSGTLTGGQQITINNIDCNSSAPPPGACIHATPWLTVSAPTNTSPMEISACTYAGEYNTITNIVAGHTYQFSSGMGSDWLVLTDASNNVLASGTTPITWTATFSGTVRLHVSANSSCLTDTWCRSTSITCTSCAGGGGGGSGYLHPVDGQQFAFVGACMVNLDCGASHDYYDDGGPSGHYSNNIGTLWLGKHGIYRTFCPDVPGHCIRAQVQTMNIEEAGAFSCYDELIVINGATQNNTPLWHGCGTHLSPVTLAGGWSGGTYTANNSSGCLGFRFYSDASGTRDGWHITLSCVPCVDAQQISNNDCGTSMPICDVTSFTGVSPGPGLDGICSGCVISENYSSWYYFEITADGVLGITITPNNLLDDYDFALYNGGADCSALGAPIRCSYAEGTGATGMGNGAWDNTEDVTGDGWVSTLNVTAGDAYYLMVNNWSPGGSGFEISFQWGGGAGADCAIVPIDLLSFDGQCSEGKATLQWATASELNNDYYTVMKSGNGITFKTIGWVMGAGTSNNLNFYSFTDDEENDKPMYYQLKQTDFDGTVSFSKMIQVDCGHIKEFNLTVADNTDNGYIEALFNAVPHFQYNITLVDATGKTVYNEVVSGDDFIRHKISTENLAQGIYVLNVHSQANSHYQKIMIR